jgi:hypothetical protein
MKLSISQSPAAQAVHRSMPTAASHNLQFRSLLCVVPALPVLTLGLMLATPQAVAGVIGFWRFEEGTPPSPATGLNSVYDYSGHNLHATPINGPLYSADLSASAIAIGSTRSMRFNGLDHWLFVPDDPSLQITHGLTIEAFIKAEPLQPGRGAGGNILMYGDTRPGFDPYRLTLLAPGNILTFGIQNAANQTVGLSYTIPYDQWLHVAGTLDDATGLMQLYVNGSLVNSTTTSIRPFAGLDPSSSPGLGIGCDQTGQYGESFNGWLDEVRLSNTALNPEQFVLIPEPSAVSLFGIGAAALWLLRRPGR